VNSTYVFSNKATPCSCCLCPIIFVDASEVPKDGNLGYVCHECLGNLQKASECLEMAAIGPCEEKDRESK